MPFLKIGMVSLFAVAASTMRRMLPFGTTVRPIVDSATRNTRYASCWLILSGAITVTFLPVDTMRGSRMKFLHVNPITNAMRSLSSVSGLNVTATGPVFFLQLYSASSSPGAGAFSFSSVFGCANDDSGAVTTPQRATTRISFFIGYYRIEYEICSCLQRRVTVTCKDVASRSLV